MSADETRARWTTQEILEVLTRHRDELRSLGVQTIGLFGSYSRGDAGPDSDIDILVTFDKPSFRNYATLNNLLEDIFGCKVDLVPEKSIRPALRPHILKDAIYATGI
jgi:predicted nucleotidyltransferase